MDQLKFNFCNYPGCKDKANPNFEDEEHGGIYCSAHYVLCPNCHKHHGRHEFVKLQTGPRKQQSGFFCKSCFNDDHMQCPNCNEVILKTDLLKNNDRHSYGLKNGGCPDCAVRCAYCDKVADKDSAELNPDNHDEYLCVDCLSENFTYCESCSDLISRDNVKSWEDGSEEYHDYCSTCYDNIFDSCEMCSSVVEKSGLEEYDGSDYCENCIEKAKFAEYKSYSDKLTTFDFTDKDKYINVLYKLLPISVKKLKVEHPNIFSGLRGLITFARGKDLDKDIVDQYRKTLDPEIFPVSYTTWDGLQRSVEENQNEKNYPTQLVLQVELSDKMKNEMSDPLIMLFEAINDISTKSGHPSTKQQLGWARLELDRKKEFILVDEIQSDHANAAHSLKNDKDEDVAKVKETIKYNYNLSDEKFIVLLNEYNKLTKSFPQIINQAITKFAQNNGFKKIYWHTYEGGASLKANSPPKSLYDAVPKEHGYKETENKPFNLPVKFFEREARAVVLKRLLKDAKHVI